MSSSRDRHGDARLPRVPTQTTARRVFAEYTLAIFLRSHTRRLALYLRTRARIPDRVCFALAPIYGPARSYKYMRARHAARWPAGREREYFVRFRSTGCNGGRTALLASESTVAARTTTTTTTTTTITTMVAAVVKPTHILSPNRVSEGQGRIAYRLVPIQLSLCLPPCFSFAYRQGARNCKF